MGWKDKAFEGKFNVLRLAWIYWEVQTRVTVSMRVVLSPISQTEGGALMQYHWRSITGKTVNYRPNKKKSSTGRIINYRPQQEEMCITSQTEIDYPSNSANEKPLPPWTLTFLWWISLKTTPPNFLLFLYKITFLSLVCWICLWPAIAGTTWIAILWLFLNKLILLVK